MQPSPEVLCRDINRISAYLAFDDFQGRGPQPEDLSGVDAIVLLGNQVVATLTAACTLAQRAPQAKLLFSGGVGHATGLLFENLRASSYGSQVEDESIRETMAEAEMYAAVAERTFAIPEGRLLVEKQSRNAGENARFSLEMLKALGLARTVLVLQDPTMQRRSILTWGRAAELTGLEPRAMSHAVFVPRVEHGRDGLPQLGNPQGTWTLERFLGLVLGEISRLHDDENGYGPQGRNFLPHVDIPEAVWESYLRVSASRLNAMALR
ncbi:MAG: YdcF family protein [Terracidiphilus sp.]|jgi:uncharacterized SAM-binding protein YcdF (DUF218 family)